MTRLLTKFPFKNMLIMVKSLKSEPNSVDIFSIASTGNSCLPDTLEVMKMISYLTNKYGQLVEVDSTWRLKFIDQNYDNPYRFRSHYLEELEKILSSLLEENMPSKRLNAILDLSKDDIEKYLEFYQQISERGKIYQKNRAKWTLEPW